MPEPQRTVYWPDELHRRIIKYLRRLEDEGRKITQSELVRRALEEYLDRHAK